MAAGHPAESSATAFRAQPFLISSIITMTRLTVSLITFLCISAGALSGFGLGLILPEHHLSSDSKDAVKMTWGILATMSALVLGLLDASAKNSFDIVINEVTEVAAKILVLNHILILYGPQADVARNELHQAVPSAINAIGRMKPSRR